MSTVTLAVALTAVLAGIAGFLLVSMVRSIRREMRRAGLRKVWRNFGLSIGFAILFFTSWIAQGFAEWHVYVSEQQTHGEPLGIADFITQFSQSTLENWQSEFLQLYSFVVMAALFIHRGSAESKDSNDRMEQKIDRIKEQLEKLSSRRS
jgi:H+/Cl- antiporter ClcA